MKAMKGFALPLVLGLLMSCGHAALVPSVAQVAPEVRRLTWIDRLPALTTGQATPEYETSCITPMSRRFVSGATVVTEFAVCIAEHDEQTDENPQL